MKHLGSRMAARLGLAVQGINRQPCFLVARRRHFLVELPADAVLRAEERDERDVARAEQRIDRAGASLRPARLIRQQTDPFAAQPRKCLAVEHVDAGQDRDRERGPFRAATGRVVNAARLVTAGPKGPHDIVVGEKVGRRHSRHLRAERRDVALAVRMHAVGQKDDVALRLRLHPERRAGEAGVAERFDRKQIAAIRRERRVDVPAEPAHVGHRCGRRRRRHPGDRRRRKDAR